VKSENEPGTPEGDVDAAWAAEIERRCAAVDAGLVITSDWEDFRRRIERDIFGCDDRSSE
jgi:putative addiction module component (TIGR02574 family)